MVGVYKKELELAGKRTKMNDTDILKPMHLTYHLPTIKAPIMQQGAYHW